MSTSDNIRFMDCEIGGKAFDVYSVHAIERLSQPFEVTVRLVATKEKDPDEFVDKEGFVTLIRPGGKERYFHGIVGLMKLEGRSGNRFIYVAKLVPKFWKLDKKTDVRIYQEVSTKDILKKVLEENGIVSLDYDLRLHKEYVSREYCVQYRESCRAFLERLMAEEGMFYYFEIKDKKHVMVIDDSHDGHNQVTSDPDIHFLEKAQLNDKGECINVFSKTDRITSGKAVLADYHFQTPKKLPHHDKKGGEYKELELYDYPGLIIDESTGRRLIEVNLELGEQGQTLYSGMSQCKQLSVGHRFKLVDHPNKKFNAEYVVSSVIHKGTQTQALQELTDGRGSSFGNSFTCVPLKQPLRTPKLLKPSVQGIQTAVVTGPSGEEIYTDEYGRIKVQFHWDREGKKDEKSSCWMRVAQPWAGSGWGSVFIPRIGQEVIVNFIDGDPDRPLVTGAVYNGNNMPPYPLPAEKTKSTLKTHSTKGGGKDNFNELRFEDKKGSEEIYLQGEKDWNIEIKNDKSQHVGNDESLNVDNDRFKTVGKNQSEDVGENKSINVGKNHDEVIGGNMSLTVEKDQTNVINGKVDTQIAKTVDQQVGKDVSIQVGGDINVDGSQNLNVNITKDINVISGTQLQIKVGSAMLTMKKNGDVTVQGGKITVKGSKDLILKGSKIAAN